eukprot:TRINITY_DN3210_c0_g1_i1.p1 TRINITY_DN3210_c0_g1~~TRINITY_DN3210_c0_g1_i1.p1  ORF type:complete len:421 (-),score=120.21 TRINITY_DN3210_c0_g1_i1:41-1267(-)
MSAPTSSALPILGDRLRALQPALEAVRHKLHAWPEAAFEEHATQAALRDFLRERAPSVAAAMRPCASTGWVVDLCKPGTACTKTVALRADMDGLKMTEGNACLPYRSTNDGRAHMCGHDGHMTMLLGAAVLLSEALERFPEGGRVRLLFQPAEEDIGGASVMIKEGALDGVDEIYGAHAWGEFPLGELRVKSGPVMAHVQLFDMTIKGKGGHASAPHLTVDPVVAACQTVVALQSIVSRNVNPLHPAVLSVPMIHGGSVNNVIPDQVMLAGTVRTYDAEACETITRRFNEVVEGTCRAMGATADINLRSLYPALVNSEGPAARVQKVAERVMGPGAVSAASLPMMSAEDFAFYTRVVPGAFYFIGNQDAQHPCLNHQTNFDYNDALICPGVELFVRLVEDFFGTPLYT